MQAVDTKWELAALKRRNRTIRYKIMTLARRIRDGTRDRSLSGVMISLRVGEIADLHSRPSQDIMQGLVAQRGPHGDERVDSEHGFYQGAGYGLEEADIAAGTVVDDAQIAG
jgi:hypothetical protein